MKRPMMKLMAALGIGILTLGQAAAEDIVKLKNGSEIHGKVVEIVPGDKLKVQTSDGSVWAYGVDEVDIIEFEKDKAESPRTEAIAQAEEPEVQNEMRPSRGEWGNGTRRGYRGFVEVGYTAVVDDTDDIVYERVGEDGLLDYDVQIPYSTEHVDIITVHGYQFNPHIFVGGGSGLQIYTDMEKAALPLFGAFRWDALDKRCSPFVEARIGAVLDLEADDERPNRHDWDRYRENPTRIRVDRDHAYDMTGVLFGTSVGCRVAIVKTFGLNVSVGYSLQTYQYCGETYGQHGVAFALGVEF